MGLLQPLAPQLRASLQVVANPRQVVPPLPLLSGCLPPASFKATLQIAHTPMTN
jgi:hypothetical protein